MRLMRAHLHAQAADARDHVQHPAPLPLTDLCGPPRAQLLQRQALHTHMHPKAASRASMAGWGAVH